MGKAGLGMQDGEGHRRYGEGYLWKYQVAHTMEDWEA